MNVWLVTTGSSDVQLISDEDWNDWWQEIKKSLYRLPFKPARAIDDEEAPYRLPARVLGTAYDRLPDEVQPILTLPLLQDFTRELKAQEIVINQIIVLMSDQGNIFAEVDRETKRCPYWQDTCQLYPILENYFHQQFPDATVAPLILKPQLSERGLDDWDAVLGLVQQEVRSLEFETEPQTVYVSHQAGTPAISSAVQFSSLAKFGDRTRFLVSSEQNIKPPKILPSSSYLKGIRLQEARTLLNRYDYSGVQAIIEPYLKDDKDTKILLNAAIQWNFANFDKKQNEQEETEQSSFIDELQNLSDSDLAQEIEKRRQNWWWIAYEEVYLAVIRKEQGNIVEAFFHSFRAFEGIFAAWGKHQLGEYVEFIKGIPYLSPSVLDNAEDYFSKKRCNDVSDLKNLKVKLENLTMKPSEEVKSEDRVELNMATLCKFFRSCRYKEYKRDCEELKIFWDNDKEKNVSEKRNFIVHQIQGMSKSNLWEFWGISSSEESEGSKDRLWKDRLLKFLNFIAKPDISEKFNTLEEASLMAKVHKELKSAIANL